MELKILEDKKNKIVFQLPGEDHTLCHALKRELWTDKTVKVAAYRIAHPLVGIPTMQVETTQGTEAKKAIQAAVKRLSGKVEKIKTAAKSL